ncbi:MAG TPA: hypothetical protein VJ754_08960 [Anaerolineae bacterium]|nr:hypothetical protein [Anaerolineae bacterium]
MREQRRIDEARDFRNLSTVDQQHLDAEGAISGALAALVKRESRLRIGG